MTRVLIVDDSPESLHLLRALLEGHGYVVDEARHGAVALASARLAPPDLVISDLLMPVLDGYALLRQWRADERLRAIPFVVYTATCTDPRDERLALDLGADAFIVEPADPESLLARIREVLVQRDRIPAGFRGPQLDERVLLEEYSSVLVRKLERKAHELERSNRELREEIAEHRRVGGALEDSEARYRKLFHSIADPLFVFDRETLAYLDVNDVAVAKYGYSREEFLRMRLTDIRPEEEVGPLLDVLQRMQPMLESHGVWKHRKKSGEIIDVDVYTYAVDFSGRAACMVHARDVTEQRRAAAEIERTTELLRAVANGTPDVVFVKDRSGRYLLCNEAAARYLGRSVPEILGRDDAAVLGAKDARAVRDSDREVMESGHQRTIEEVLTTALGPRAFQTVKVPYRDRGGQVIGVIGIARDVTQRKRTEEALRLHERAIQAVSQGILITDPNQADNPIVYASAGFERLCGYRVEETLGRNCRFLQGRDTDRDTIAALRAAIAEGRSASVEILNYRKDGAPFWNQLTISPVRDDAGRLTHFVGIQTDITERRSLEAQLRQSQKMEAFGQLAGGVAHDFNNLLTVICGHSELLLSNVPPEDPNWASADEIREAGERAAALTRQLLAFSRQSVLAPELLNLNAVIDETEKMLRRMIGEDVALTTVLDPMVHPVRVDPSQVAQVLMNLAVNARDAMPKGGQLTIETRNVTLDEHHVALQSETPPGAYVMLAMSDTGSGMPPEVLRRIFEPFFTTKGVGRGTGLGLAVVHGIVKQSGGSIQVHSEPDRGTVFQIYLPAVEPEATRSSGAAGISRAAQGTETVLLVEDEDGVRGLAIRALESHGYTVLAARNGGEAMRLAEAHADEVAILVTDVVMPGMDGSELANALSARLPDLRVLFVSGYTDDAVVRHGILQESVAFLQKPFSPRALARKVREVLDA